MKKPSIVLIFLTILSACTGGLPVNTKINDPVPPVLVPVQPVPVPTPDIPQVVPGRIIISTIEQATALPCTLEPIPANPISKPVVLQERWTTAPVVTPEAFGVNRLQQGSLVRDAQGNTIVVGSAYALLAGDQTKSFPLVVMQKWDTTGKQIWSRSMALSDHQQNQSLWVSANAVAQSGDLYLIVWITPSGSISSASTRWLFKFDPNGTLVWQRLLESGVTFFQQLLVDARGGVWLNSQRNISEGHQEKLQRFDADGSCRAERTFNLAVNTNITQLVADDFGAVYLAGFAHIPPRLDSHGNVPIISAEERSNTGAFIAKLDWKAKPVWFHFLNASRKNDFDLTYAVEQLKVADKHLVLAARYTRENYKPRSNLKKYNLNGDLIWAQDIDSSGFNLMDDDRRVGQMLVRADGGFLLTARHSGVFPNCCVSAPYTEYWLLSLYTNGSLVKSRHLEHSSGWSADGPGDFVTTIKGDFGSSHWSLVQSDPWPTLN